MAKTKTWTTMQAKKNIGTSSRAMTSIKAKVRTTASNKVWDEIKTSTKSRTRTRTRTTTKIRSKTKTTTSADADAKTSTRTSFKA